MQLPGRVSVSFLPGRYYKEHLQPGGAGGVKRFLAILAIMAAGIMLCPGGTLHLGLRHKDQTMQTAKTEVGVAAWTAET